MILLGHSEGVNFATEIAAKPEWKPIIQGVVLLAGLGHYTIEQTILRQIRDVSQAAGPEAEQYKLLLQQGETFFERLRMGLASTEDSFMGAYSRYWREWNKLTERSCQVASRLEVPSLVIQGDVDWNVSLEDFHALKDATHSNSRSDSLLVAGCNHALTIGDSRAVAPAILAKIQVWIDGILSDRTF